MVRGASSALCDVFGDPSALFELDALDDLGVDAVGVVDVSGRVRQRDDRAAECLDLLSSEDSDVSGAGDGHGASVEVLLRRGQHVFEEVDHTVAGGFGANHRAAVRKAFTGQHSGFVGVRQSLVLAEQVADLASADTDVAGGNVAVLADVSVELGHERLAEAHDFLIAAALRVEVGAALAAADGQAGDRVLEDLLEAEELHDAEVDRGVEAQTALIGSECGVELHAEGTVDLDDAGVIDPGDPEYDLPFRFAQALESGELQILGMLVDDGPQGVKNFLYRLVKLRLSGIAMENGVEDWLQ